MARNSHASGTKRLHNRKKLRRPHAKKAVCEQLSESTRGDIQLAKHSVQRVKKSPRKRSSAAPKATHKASPPAVQKKSKSRSLTDILNPKNIQDSLKAVGNVRNIVKNCLQYLQQADRMLETFHVTSNSLRESGVLEKIVKQKGKNLTTDDFTNVLIALMNSPLGSQFFKAMGNQSNEEEAKTTPPDQS